MKWVTDTFPRWFIAAVIAWGLSTAYLATTNAECQARKDAGVM